MNKRIFFFIVVVLAVGAGVYGYLYFKKLKTPVSEAIHAIPTDAALIFHSYQGRELWKKLSQNNMMWSDLRVTERCAVLDRDIHLLDSTIAAVPEGSELLRDHPFFVSLHPNKESSFDILIAYSLPDITRQPLVESIIEQLAFEKKKEKQKFSSVEIISVQLQAHKFLYYAFEKGVLLCSYKKQLLQRAITQLQSGSSILRDSAFAKAYHSAGKKVDANLFVNYKYFPSLLHPFMNKRAVQFVSALAHFADWTAADISLRPNAVMMNGFTICSVTDSMFLNVFRKIPPQRIEITKVLPSNTALFLFYGIGNYNAYREYYYKYLESAHRRSSVDAALKKINEKYKIDVEKSLTSWINNEVVYGILEPALQEIDENSFAAIRSNNIEYAEEQLKSLVDSVNKMSESRVDTENYNGHIIRYLDIPDALPQLLGKDFSTLHQHYFCTIKDYIFFANTSSTLKKIIQSIETEKTLSNNENYKQFAEKIAEEANVYLYTNIARSAGIYSNFTALTYSGEILQNIDNFRKFEAFAFQFSSNQDMFYSNFYLKHNPVYKRDPSSLWETKLDTTVSSAPVIVSNHTNDTKEILVQDDANALYLISNTGKVLWKKELPEKIKSGIYQIDAYKNEKLQYLFNTTEAIYLLDRNGKDCKGYPVKLKSPATNALTVYDYDNNHDYRFFIACDKKIYSYKKDGKLNEKWKFDKSKETIHAPVQYAVVDGKDYLIAIDNKGKTYLANRQGELRLKLRETFNVPVKDFFVDEGNSPENTWMIVCDSLGNVLRLSFSDVLENQKLKKFAHPPYFDYQDLDGKSDHKKEYIFLEPEQLSVYSQDKNLLFTYALNNAVAGPPQYFYFPDKKGKIGLSSNKEIIMLDHNGTVCPGFPLYGIAPFCIYDINGDKLLNVIVAGEKGVIYAYTIE